MNCLLFLCPGFCEYLCRHFVSAALPPTDQAAIANVLVYAHLLLAPYLVVSCPHIFDVLRLGYFVLVIQEAYGRDECTLCCCTDV